MDRARGKKWFGRWGVFALALVVFFGWLGRRDVTTSHEARVAQTARVMAAAGWPWDADAVEVPSLGVRADPKGTFAVGRYDLPPLRVNPWLVPVLNNEVRLQKPPLPNWCTAAVYRAFGVSEFTTRVVPALLGAVATLFVIDLAGLLLGRAVATIAGFVWVSTLVAVSEFREATPDPFLAFFTLTAVWAWTRAAAKRGCPTGLMLVFYASLGLGVMAKGPFIFIHAAVALLAHQLCYRRRPDAPWAAHVAGFALTLAIALPWPAYVLTSVPDVARLWEMETTRGRGGDGSGGATAIGELLRDSWRYPARLPDFALPWTPVWLVGIASALGKPRRRRRLFPLVWCAATVAAFSLSTEKKNAYLLPMLPAQALLVTQGAVAAGTILRGRSRDQRRGRGWRRRRADARRWLPPLATAGAVGCLLMAGWVRPAKDNARSAKSFGRAVADEVMPPANMLMPHLPAEAAFYLPLGMRYDPRAAHVYDAVEPPRGRPFDVSRVRPKLPYGRIVHAEVVPVPELPADARWRLVKLTVEPDPGSPVWVGDDSGPLSPVLGREG